jgi:Ca-activated chloride channel family protein
MKIFYIKHIILFIALVFTNLIFGQEGLSYAIEVTENHQPKGNLEIVLVETTTFERKVFKTSADGRLIINLNEGKEWVMNVGEMKNYKLLKVSEFGGVGSATIPYDVERWKRLSTPPVNRSKMVLVKVPQKGITSGSIPQRGNSIVEIELKTGKGQVWRSVAISMVCFEDKMTYDAFSDSKGVARFYLPNNKHYQIDVDGEVDYDYCDLGNQSVVKSLRFLYEKIEFKEVENIDGYIEQSFAVKPEPMSNRFMVTIVVNGGSNDGIGEDVYLDMTYSNKKYYGVTNADGEAVFMLPKKRNYLVSFKYQKHVGVIDLSRVRGIGQMKESYTYVPDPRLENPEDYLPTASEVKAYDLNAFNKTVYAKTDDELINVHAKWGSNKINSGSKEAILELGFSVNEPQIKKSIPKPLNISFVLDKSGSMSGESMDILKKSMLKFIEKLRPIDKVSLVFFDNKSIVAYPQKMVNKSIMKDIIGAIYAGGGTNIYEGLKMGYEQVSASYNSESVNRVILLTDGYGSKPIDFILEQSKKYFNNGISVSTIGVGQGYNNALLSMLSKYSGGFEHNVIEAEGIYDALNAEFESLFFPLASNLKVSVYYNDKIIYKTLYGIPESKIGNKMVSFELKHVFSSLNKMALMKFKLDNPTKAIEKDLITIKVNYFDEQKGRDIEIVKERHLNWTDETDIEMIYDQQLKEVYSVATVNQCLKAIADLCDEQNYAAAKKNIHQTLKAIHKITGDNYSVDLLPLINELEVYLEVLDVAIKKKK